jgi:membrane associated rhomboid family serine protease
MNYGLIAVNVIIFGLMYLGGQQSMQKWGSAYMLTPAYPYLWQFLTYAFLHGSVGHIFGNMYFLYIFGNNVNDRLGNLGYLLFYLAGAVFSALGHIFAAHIGGEGAATPVLGASGAIAAVTGAYLVLFPQTLITIVYWLFFIGTMEIPALYLIIIKMIVIDNVISRNVANVAYDAHLAGYAFGIGAILLLRMLSLLQEDHFDLWSMVKQWNRRRVYRDVVAEGVDPFGGTISKKIEVKEVKSQSQIQVEEKVSLLRRDILTRLSEGNIASATELYQLLIKEDDNQPLPRQAMLDIANQLMSTGTWTVAAQAYERFLSSYGNYEFTEQVMLMLGVIYGRYLSEPKKALEYLKKAVNRLSDPAQKKMCEEEIRRLEVQG